MGNFDGERTPIILCLPCFQRSLCALSKTVVVGIWKRREAKVRDFSSFPLTIPTTTTPTRRGFSYYLFTSWFYGCRSSSSSSHAGRENLCQERRWRGEGFKSGCFRSGRWWLEWEIQKSLSRDWSLPRWCRMTLKKLLKCCLLSLQVIHVHLYLVRPYFFVIVRVVQFSMQQYQGWLRTKSIRWSWRLIVRLGFRIIRPFFRQEEWPLVMDMIACCGPHTWTAGRDQRRGTSMDYFYSCFSRSLKKNTA